MSTTYAQLFLRRDVEAYRTTCTPGVGEPFCTTDMEELWMGDGATAGGIFYGGSGLSQVGADITPTGAATLAINPAKHFVNYLQRLIAIGAGGGAYTYTVTLSRLRALPGACLRVYAELPASVNPTVQIEDVVGATVLATVTTPNGGAAAAYWWGDFQLGPDGAWHLTARGWN